MRTIPWRQGLIASAALIFVFAFASPFRTPKILATTLLLLPLIWRRKRIPFSMPLLVLLFWPLVSFAWSVNPWDFLQGLLLLAVCFLALLALPLDEESRIYLSGGLALAGVATAAYLACQRLGWDPFLFEQGTAAGGFFGNLNFSAHFLLLCLFLARFPPRFRYLGPAFLVFGILISASRGTWLALLVLAWAWPRPLARRTRAFFSVAVLVALLFALVFFRQDLKRGGYWLTHPSAYCLAFKQQPRLIAEREPWFRGKRLSLMTRVILYGNSSAMLTRYGLFGAGLGQFEVTYPRFAKARFEDINMSSLYRAGSAHNLGLDVAIQFGVPWLLLALFLLVDYFRRTRDSTRWWLAVLSQALIAVFSLNYLNPMILVPLILLAPETEHRQTVPGSRPLSGAFFLVIVSIAFCDLSPQNRPAFLFPEQQARFYYKNGDFASAWDWQVRAFLQDPYGPETLYNLGLIAESRGSEDPAWQELALLSLALDRSLHPNYSPAHLHLEQRFEPGQIAEALLLFENIDAGVRLLKLKVSAPKVKPFLPSR